MTSLFPVPDEEGVAKLIELYLNRFGVRLTPEEAHERLAFVMRLLYLLNPNYPGYSPASHPLEPPPDATPTHQQSDVAADHPTS